MYLMLFDVVSLLGHHHIISNYVPKSIFFGGGGYDPRDPGSIWDDSWKHRVLGDPGPPTGPAGLGPVKATKATCRDLFMTCLLPNLL